MPAQICLREPTLEEQAELEGLAHVVFPPGAPRAPCSIFRTRVWCPWNQLFQHAAHCIIMSQGNGLRHSKLPRQGCIFRQVLVRLPALAPMPAPTLVVPGSSTVSRNSSLSQLSR